MRCDQCKHWKLDDEDWESKTIGFGECTAIRERWTITDEASEGLEWGAENEGAYMKSRRDALIAAKAYVQDGSQYHADLQTAPDFFCALFEAR